MKKKVKIFDRTYTELVHALEECGNSRYLFQCLLLGDRIALEKGSLMIYCDGVWVNKVDIEDCDESTVSFYEEELGDWNNVGLYQLTEQMRTVVKLVLTGNYPKYIEEFAELLLSIDQSMDTGIFDFRDIPKKIIEEYEEAEPEEYPYITEIRFSQPFRTMLWGYLGPSVDATDLYVI